MNIDEPLRTAMRWGTSDVHLAMPDAICFTCCMKSLLQDMSVLKVRNQRARLVRCFNCVITRPDC